MRTLAKACGAWALWSCLLSVAGAQQIQWQSDLETAKRVAAASNRLVLLHFSASWCHWCKPLETNVFAKPEVAQAIQTAFVPVRMDYDEHRQIAKQYGVRGVPWEVVITPDGYWVEDFNSPQSADKYAERLNKIASREAAKSGGMYAGGPTPQQGPQQVAAAQPWQQGPANQAAAAPQAPANPGRSDDRYAEYFASRQPAPRHDPVAPPYTQQVSTPTANYAANSGPSYAPSTPPQQQLAQAGSLFGPGPALSAPATSPHLPGAPQLTPDPTPAGPQQAAQQTFCLDGHCPVKLLTDGAWIPGDRRYGAHHRGKTYLFCCESCQKAFLADPDRYAPVLSGNDPVALVDRGQTVPGRREHGCYFGTAPNRRIVLFADEASFEAFKNNPQRYAGQILAAPK